MDSEDFRLNFPTASLERKWLEQATSDAGPGSFIRVAPRLQHKQISLETEDKHSSVMHAEPEIFWVGI